MIGIIDCSLGNVGSILNMCKKVGVQACRVSNESEVAKCNKLILPGVGAFDKGMTQLNERGLVSVINKKVLEDQFPILGICLGMQLMTRSSEEGQLSGLGVIDAETIRFSLSEESGLRLPHMGWNIINKSKEHLLLDSRCDELRFYFVHNYHVVLDNADDELCSTEYGYKFTSGFAVGNIWGVQFHPEKSHKFGMDLIRNFAEGI